MHRNGRILLLLSLMAIIIMYLQYNIAKNKVHKPEDTSRDVEKLPETGEALPAQVNKLQKTRELLPGLVSTLQAHHPEHNHSILNTDKPSIPDTAQQKTEDTAKHADKSKEVTVQPSAAEKTLLKETVIEDAIVDESLPLCPENPPKLSMFLTNIGEFDQMILVWQIIIIIILLTLSTEAWMINDKIGFYLQKDQIKLNASILYFIFHDNTDYRDFFIKGHLKCTHV